MPTKGLRLWARVRRHFNLDCARSKYGRTASTPP
jgi:hypothetical protein